MAGGVAVKEKQINSAGPGLAQRNRCTPRRNDCNELLEWCCEPVVLLGRSVGTSPSPAVVFNAPSRLSAKQ